MGLVQMGRSRTWLDDHGWWVLGVHFQSSAWRKYIGLAVAADFLWRDDEDGDVALSWWRRNPDGGIPHPELREDGRNIGVEVEEFDDEDELFDRLRRVAEHAADEVRAYRARFGSIDDWFRVLTDADETSPTNEWNAFHAAVVSGLTGEVGLAQQYFDRQYEILTAPAEPGGVYAMADGKLELLDEITVEPTDWELEATKENRRLTALLDDPADFQAEITSRVQRFRARLKLPESAVEFR